MTTPIERLHFGAAVGAEAAPLPRRPARDDSLSGLSDALRSIISFNESRSTSVTEPELMDNPLFEGCSEDSPSSRPRRGWVEKPQLPDQSKQANQPRRSSVSRLASDEAKVSTKPSRRKQSWSLSSRDYEGIWRTVQENVFKSSHDSMSALEDFKHFRQKLADLKHVKEEVSAPPPTPKVLTPSGSIRSSNQGSISTRSLNLSPSRPTSPLQRLSVIKSRKGVSGLNPKRESGPQRGLAPSVHRFSLSMRAEGLFKLPNLASISPLVGDQYSSPPSEGPDNAAPKCTVAASKRGFLKGGRAAEESMRTAKAADARTIRDPVSCSPRAASRNLRSSAGGKQSRPCIAAVFTNEVESFMYSCSPRSLAALNTISPKTSRNAPQPQSAKKKLEKILVVSSCSPRAKDAKGSCIHIPRPMCYSAHILE